MKSDKRRIQAFKAAFLILSLITAALMAGCTGMNGAQHGSEGDSGMGKIAVIPFENYTKDEFANEKVRRALISELVSRGIDVVEPGEVSRAIQDLKIQYGSPLNIKDIKALGIELHVSQLIIGSVSNYGISRGMALSYPEVSVNLILVETENGSILKSISHTAGGADFWTKHFGVEGMTLSEIEILAVTEAVDLLFGK